MQFRIYFWPYFLIGYRLIDFFTQELQYQLSSVKSGAKSSSGIRMQKGVEIRSQRERLYLVLYLAAK